MIQGLYDCFSHWAKEGTVWIISDTHFGDKKLQNGIVKRPDDEALLRLINSKVGKKDTLIHLGDVGEISYTTRLKGRKILIAGNHEAGLTSYSDVFAEIYSGPLIISEKIILSHEPLPFISWAINLHGHNHTGLHHPDPYHYNFNADVINYIPINFNQFMKTGPASKVESIHRQIIDNATKKKGKKYHEF